MGSAEYKCGARHDLMPIGGDRSVENRPREFERPRRVTSEDVEVR
jgi:hypothetical protein